jgi:hypothetical protein
MAKKREHLRYGRPGGRFDPITIARRLERLRALAEVEPKDVAGRVFTNQTQENAARSWYRRTNQFRGHFQLGQIEAAVDYLVTEAQRKGKMPDGVRELPGFPFIEMKDAAKIERG